MPLLRCLIALMLFLAAAGAAAVGNPPSAAQMQHDETEYQRLRGLGLKGETDAALQGMQQLLQRELDPELRVLAYTTGISMAAGVERWQQAFVWADAGLNFIEEAPKNSALLLSVSSYLYALVGDLERAQEFGQRGLAQAEAGGDLFVLCRALSTHAIVQELRKDLTALEPLRRRQIDVCGKAGDKIFVANGTQGMGMYFAGRKHYAEALQWFRRALQLFQAEGFDGGAQGAKLEIAKSLVALNQEAAQAGVLLREAGRYYARQRLAQPLVDVEQFQAELAERRGDIADALQHTQHALQHTKELDRRMQERRLLLMQLQFDSRLKEEQIQLLEASTERAKGEAKAARKQQQLIAFAALSLLAAAALLLALLRRVFRDRQRYRFQSEHDGLTRLLNYPALLHQGAQVLAQARAKGAAFTAVVVDIDHFKTINDSHGHAAGDEVLRILARWIGEAMGQRGLAARRGGDEFTLLLNMDEPQAEVLLQHLRGLIQPVRAQGTTPTLRFSVSMGFCQSDAEGETLEQLIHRADLALYRAKHEGRDRLVSAHHETSLPSNSGLVVVGSGIQFGRHASERCLSEIRRAEVLFCLADPATLAMIQSMRQDVINLGRYYATGKDRRQTYREIDATIMAEVRAGKQVCAVFYGHPGVFADVPHRVVNQARAEGFAARMEPGISAEACLYADLGIDPGRRGVQSLEATHFLYYDRQIDPAGLLLLWQVALAGDLSCSRREADPAGLQALVDKLLRWYPSDHEVILYEAAQLPVFAPRMGRMRLSDLPAARYEEYTTLVIPPLDVLREDPYCGLASAVAE